METKLFYKVFINILIYHEKNIFIIWLYLNTIKWNFYFYF